MTINDLPLPSGLLSLIEAARWHIPADRLRLRRLFSEHGEDIAFYSPADMQRENPLRTDGLHNRIAGERDPDNPPGDIDPQKAVLIGDLGVGWDEPIALDYRLSMEQPRVLLFRSQPQRKGHKRKANRWVEIAPNIEAFAVVLGL